MCQSIDSPKDTSLFICMQRCASFFTSDQNLGFVMIDVGESLRKRRSGLSWSILATQDSRILSRESWTANHDLRNLTCESPNANHESCTAKSEPRILNRESWTVNLEPQNLHREPSAANPEPRNLDWRFGIRSSGFKSKLTVQDSRLKIPASEFCGSGFAVQISRFRFHDSKLAVHNSRFKIRDSRFAI